MFDCVLSTLVVFIADIKQVLADTEAVVGNGHNKMV